MDIYFTRRAEKDFLGLPKIEQKKAIKKISLLQEDPLVGKKLTGKLALFRCLRFWPYRIIYHLDKTKKEIWIDHLMHRQGVYK